MSSFLFFSSDSTRVFAKSDERPTRAWYLKTLGVAFYPSLSWAISPAAVLLDVLVDFTASKVTMTIQTESDRTAVPSRVFPKRAGNGTVGPNVIDSASSFPICAEKEKVGYSMIPFIYFPVYHQGKVARSTSFSNGHYHFATQTSIYAFTSTTVAELFFSSDAAFLQHERHRFPLAIESNRWHTLCHHLDTF